MRVPRNPYAQPGDCVLHTAQEIVSRHKHNMLSLLYATCLKLLVFFYFFSPYPSIRTEVPRSLLYNGYRVCFPEVKYPGRGADSPPSKAEVNNEYSFTFTSYTMGTGSFLGVKRPGRAVDHPPPFSAEVKERLELYPPPLWAFVACSRVNFTFTFIPLCLQYSEGSATGHLDTGFSWFPCV